MSTTVEPDLFERRHPIKRGEPFWDIALLFPAQGEWTEAEYLGLKTNLPIEFSDGCLEFHPLPTMIHQRIAQFLYGMLKAWVKETHARGEVFIAPLRVRLWSGKIRLPDVVYVRPERVVSLEDPPMGADLAMEVVSPGEENRERDMETKRAEYARAGIQEYWLVDPVTGTIAVLTLVSGSYQELGMYRAGSKAASALLPGFEVDVAAVFLEGKRPVE